MLRSRIARRAVVALMVVGGPALAVGTFRLGRAHDRERTLVLLGHHLETRAVALRKDLASSEAVIHACRAFIAAAPDVTSAQFETFARMIMTRHPGLQALEWAPRVTAAERDAHERRARELGVADYRIVELSESGTVVPAGNRHEYFPVFYAQPHHRNRAALGFDLGSEAVRREALYRAMATGLPSLSDPIALLQEPSGEPGMLFVAPVYASGHEPASGEMAAPLGFVCGVLRVSSLVRSSYVERGAPSPLATLELVDEGSATAPRTLYSSSPAGRAPAGPVVSVPIDAEGKRWRLRARPTSAALAAGRTPLPMELALASFLGWEGLLGLALLIMTRVEEKEARRETHLINSVINSLSDGIVVADRNGKFLFANRVAKSIVSAGTHDVPPESWSGSFGLYVPGTKTLFPTEQLPLHRAIRGENVSDVEVFIRNSRFEDGLWVNVSATPLFDEDGTVVGGVAVFRDVTAHRRSQALLQRLSSAVQQTADAVIITDRTGTIEYVNPAFETMTGFTSEEALGQTPRILRSGRQEGSYYKKLWSTILAGKPFRGSPLNTRKDGTLFHGEQTITPITSPHGEITHFVSVLRDMTERRRIEEQAIEMNLAASVQRKLFPREAPHVPGYEIAGITSPSLATCGDYYDFIPLKDGSFALVVADVCGHGVGPALIMAQTRAQLRALTRTHSDLSEIFQEISAALHADLEDNLFVTMSLASLSPDGGDLRWISAGHPSGYVLDGSGSVKTVLKSTGLPLGLLPDRGYAIGHGTAMEPGDIVLLCTDGVLEAESPDGHAFGIDRMLQTVKENLSLPADQIVARLRDEVHAHVGNGGIADDVTIVACRRVDGR